MKDYQSVNINKIDEPTDALRSTIDEKGLVELASSMKSRGLLQPILLRKTGERYEIEAGHRRFLAAKMLGWTKIDAKITDSKEADDLHLDRAHENLIRNDLNPLDEARLVYKLVYEDGRGVEETAKLLSKTTWWVEHRMDILSWPMDIQNALQAGQITLAQAKELQKVSDDASRARLLESAINFGASAAVIRRWIDDTGVDMYLKAKDELSDSESMSALESGGTFFECRVCGIPYNVSLMRHIWLCPECLVGIRDLAKEVRTEILKRNSHSEESPQKSGQE